MSICQNPYCGEVVGQVVCGLCRPCYQHQRRYGTTRHEPVENGGSVRGICRHCKQGAVEARGLCHACYLYQYKRGKPRPRYLWAEACRVCQRPRDGAPWPFARGRCQNCYQYLYRTGRERPQELISRQAPQGWCDCGEPAIKTIEVRISQHTQALPLCRECLELERGVA